MTERGMTKIASQARSLGDIAINALEEFRSLGIEFVSLHEGVDTSTANGRLVFGIFATIAEFERELIRDRVRSGIASARAKGKRIGRPKVIVDACVVAAMRTTGASWNTISRTLGNWKGDGAEGPARLTRHQQRKSRRGYRRLSPAVRRARVRRIINACACGGESHLLDPSCRFPTGSWMRAREFAK